MIDISCVIAAPAARANWLRACKRAASCCLGRAAPPLASLKYTFMRSSCRSLFPCNLKPFSGALQCQSSTLSGLAHKLLFKVAAGYLVGAHGIHAVLIADHLENLSERILSTCCRQEYRRNAALSCTAHTSQNFAPIWLPHWPPWICTISRILTAYSLQPLSLNSLQCVPACAFPAMLTGFQLGFYKAPCPHAMPSTCSNPVHQDLLCGVLRTK